MRLTLCALIFFLCSFCFLPPWNGDILLVLRSADLSWSDGMTNQQINNSWERGSGPSGVTTFLWRVWESLLTSIYLWFLIWKPWQQNNTVHVRLSVFTWVQQSRHLSYCFCFLFFVFQQVQWDRQADWERCFSHFPVYIDHLGSCSLWNPIP